MDSKRRLAKLTLYTIITFACLWAISILVISMIYVENLLRPDCNRMLDDPAGFESVVIETADGLLLKGWWRPPENGIAVLLLGGLGASRDAMLPEAQMLASHGYGALTLDYRHCAGKITSLGIREVNELRAMVFFAQSQPDVEHIAALGFSVGGAAVLLGAAKMPQIEAVIAEGNYANLKEEIAAGSPAPFSLLWQIKQGILFTYHLRTGTSPANVSPIEAIPQIAPRPILFIHGETEINRTAGQAQFASAENARLWVVPGAGHGSYLQSHPQEYEQRVIQFLQEYLMK